MSAISTAIELTDRFTAPLQNICASLSIAIDGLEQMQYASGKAFDTSSLETARAKLAEGVVQINEIAGNTDKAKNKQEQYNQKISAGTSAADGLLGKVKTLVGAYVGISTVKNTFGLSDELTQTTARLDMMVSQYNQLNGTMQTTSELADLIYQSAQDSRASYLGTAASVAKLGNNARDAFSSTEEIVGFAELVNKQFTIAGASAQESSNAFMQLTQALGSGVLRGDELNSIFEQAPNLIQTVADYMGVPIGQVRAMASEGQITADIVKNAMFSAEDEINARFAEMPMTWGQLWTSFTNQATRKFEPLLQRLNAIANSDNMQKSITGVMDSLSVMAKVAVNVIDIMAAGGAFIVDNWSVIGPIIGTITTALLIYNGILIAHNVIESISNGLKAVSAARSALKSGSTLAEAAATTTATGAQVGFNAALLACPLTWIIVIIVAVIAAVIALANHIAHTGETATTAFGVICGWIYVVGAFFKNLGLSVANIALGIGNAIAALGSNIKIAFHNAILSVQERFYGLLSTALYVVSCICAALNKLPFIEFDYSGVVDKANEYAAKASEAAGNKQDYKSISEAYNAGHSTFDTFQDGWVDSAYANGAAFGDGITNKVKGFFGGTESEKTDSVWDNLGSYGTSSEMAGNISNIAGDTSSIADAVDVSEEDLKYLRDIAEQEAVNRFTTAEIKIDMSGMKNTVHNTNDLDGIVDGMTAKLLEAMEVVKEGV